MLQDVTDGSEIRLHWHLDGTPGETCADRDELHQRIADALGLPGVAGDEAACVEYLALRQAIIERHGVSALRGCIDVRHDYNGRRFTLRGPGEAWGKLTPRGTT